MATTAYVERAELSAAGPVSVKADESALMHATLDAEVVSSGGGVDGSGASTAANVAIATNWLQGDAHAYIARIRSRRGRRHRQCGQHNEFGCRGQQATEAGGEAGAGLIAFNAVGWQPQNVLFTLIDTLIGSEEIASAFDANQRISSLAHMDAVDLDASGDLTVTCAYTAILNA